MDDRNCYLSSVCPVSYKECIQLGRPLSSRAEWTAAGGRQDRSNSTVCCVPSRLVAELRVEWPVIRPGVDQGNACRSRRGNEIIVHDTSQELSPSPFFVTRVFDVPTSQV